MYSVSVLCISLLVLTTLRFVNASPSPATANAIKSENIKNHLTAEIVMLLNKFPAPKSSEVTDTPKSTVTPRTENLVEYPTPITLTASPNYTTYSDLMYDNLTCTASGVNLPNLKPYDLSWYEQVDGGKDSMIISVHNGISVSMHRNMTQKYRGSTVFCVLIFNKLTKKHYSQLRGHYITILKLAKLKKSYMTIITSGITVSCLLGMLVIAALLYRKKKRNTNPPTLSREISVSSAIEAEHYSPIQTVPLYEAKAMAAANKKVNNGFQTKPPPLPLRTHHCRKVDDENEYVYAYA